MYETVPSRREFQADLVGSDLGAEATQRLLRVVQRVVTWPRTIPVRRIEVAFENRRRIGTVVFERVRTNERFDVWFYGRAAK
jgi:hypothetical protein